MNELEKTLLASVVEDGHEPRLTVRSRMRIDAGRWCWKSRFWVCVMDADIILLAVARRRYIERVSLADCRDSRYSHESGELVLAPIETVEFPRIRMSPRSAVAVLRHIRDNTNGNNQVYVESEQVDQSELNEESFSSENE